MTLGRFRGQFTKNLASRRRFLQILGVGAASLALDLIAACRPSSSPPRAARSPEPDSGSGGPENTTRTSGALARGGKLTAVRSADLTPSSLLSLTPPTNYYLAMGVYNRVMHYRTDSLEPEAELASSWGFSADYRSLTIRLREGIRFHSGRPLTSEDVRWCLERVADPDAGSYLLNQARWIERMETPDELTLILHLDRPRPSILDIFELLFIVDRETFDEARNGKKFVGTGPFIFQEWLPGDHHTLIRNHDYWQPDRPYLDEVVVKIIPDAQSQLIHLQTGAADIAHDLDPLDIKTLPHDQNFALVSNPVMGSIFYVGIDVQSPLFRDKRVRQAMSYLVDRQRIVDSVVYFGRPTRLPWDIDPKAYAASPASGNGYDPERAKQLLSSANVPRDAVAPIYVSDKLVPRSGAIAEVFQNELAAVGLKSTVEPLEPTFFLQKLQKGEFGGLWIAAVNMLYLTPSSLFVLGLPFRIPNASNYDTPGYRALIDQALNTTDQAALQGVYRQIDELWLDECFVIPICSSELPAVRSTMVHDLLLSRGGFPVLAGVWRSAG